MSAFYVIIFKLVMTLYFLNLIYHLNGNNSGILNANGKRKILMTKQVIL